MRILHVIRGLTNSSGTTHIVIPLAEQQARMGHAVTVLHVAKPGERSLNPDAGLVASGVFPMTISSQHLGLSIGFAREMAKVVGDFDVVHIHAVWNFVTSWGLRCALRARVPVMVAPQGSFDPVALGLGSTARKLYAQLVELPLLKKASRFQALTGAEARQIAAMGISVPCVTIPNGVSIDDFDRQKAVPSLAISLGLPPGSKTVLFLGRLHEKKGLDILVSAFGKLGTEAKDAILIIAGHDAGSGYRQIIERQAREVGVADRMIWLGEVKGDQKYRTFIGADIFLLPSRSEGLPVAVLEAMAAGRPVVVSAACNIPEVQECEAGIVVAANPDAVANALRQMLADPEFRGRCGRNGRKLVEEKFSWPAISRSCLEVYETMRVERQMRT